MKIIKLWPFHKLQIGMLDMPPVEFALFRAGRALQRLGREVRTIATEEAIENMKAFAVALRDDRFADIIKHI